jgi:hypothetical protein
MDCKAAEVTDDEASVEAPKVSQNKTEKTTDGVRPVANRNRANEGGHLQG